MRRCAYCLKFGHDNAARFCWNCGSYRLIWILVVPDEEDDA
jgi:hypothetical protein